MNNLQLFLVLVFFGLAIVAYIRSRFVWAITFAFAGFLFANYSASAEERPVLTLAVVTDFALAPDVVDRLLGDVAHTYREQLSIDVAVIWNEENQTTPGDENPNFLLPKLLPLDHHGANVLLLITQRTLHVGNTLYAGFATNSTPCTSNATAVIKRSGDDALDAQVIKHELGHTIGLPHDGEGECSNETSPAYIMGPRQYANVNDFSQCSKDVAASILRSYSQCMAPKTAAAIVAPAAIPTTPAGGGGELTEWFILVLVLIVAIVQAIRAAEWKSQARISEKHVKEYTEIVQGMRAQYFDLHREARVMRKTLATYAATQSPTDLSIARQLGQLEAYGKAITECNWGSAREGGTAPRDCTEIRDAIYVLRQEVLKNLPAEYECEAGHTHPIGERCIGQCVF